MSAEKVLVLNATGKVGRNVCRALREAGGVQLHEPRGFGPRLRTDRRKKVVRDHGLLPGRQVQRRPGISAGPRRHRCGQGGGRRPLDLHERGGRRIVRRAHEAHEGHGGAGKIPSPIGGSLLDPAALRIFRDSRRCRQLEPAQKGRGQVPDALTAEDWFRFHGRYADGTPIVSQA